MKVAIIAKLFAPVSKLSTGGTETFVYNLALELQKNGHDVTLFATGDSQIKGIKLIPVVPESFWLKFNRATNRANMLFNRKLMSDEILGYIKILFYLKKNHQKFDIIHNNSFNFLPLSLNQFFIDLPFMTTLHVPEKNSNTVRILNELTGKDKTNNYFVAVSKQQADLMKDDLKIFTTNYNGVEIERFKFSVQSDNYLGWIGRIVPEKGCDVALDIAANLGLPIKIIGAKANRAYFNEVIAPKLKKTKHAEYLGEVIGDNLVHFYQRAKVLLFPISWDEPFGLVMAEAMACGTPVVAFRRGSVSEIVKDGKTGFICPPGDMDCMVKKVKQIYEMPEAQYQQMRQNCRKHVEENFTVEKMVDGYEKVYEKVIKDYKSKAKNSNDK